MRKFLIVFLLILLYTTTLPFSVNAQYCINGNPSNLSATPVDPISVYTALGCVSADNKSVVSIIVNIGVGIAGGIALITLVLSGFQISTAGGDPKKVQAAKELITSSIAGLCFIMLIVVILNFIGVNVLGLRSLGFNNP
jgi:hypothetical protein